MDLSPDITPSPAAAYTTATTATTQPKQTRHLPPLTDADFPGRGARMSVLIAIDSARGKLEQARNSMRHAIHQMRTMAPECAYIEPATQIEWRLTSIMGLGLLDHEIARHATLTEFERVPYLPTPQQLWEPLPLLTMGRHGVLIYDCPLDDSIRAAVAESFGKNATAISIAALNHDILKMLDDVTSASTDRPVVFLHGFSGHELISKFQGPVVPYAYIAGLLGLSYDLLPYYQRGRA